MLKPAPEARGAVEYVETFGNGSDTVYTITHNLNRPVVAQVVDTATGDFPAANTYTAQTSPNAITVTLLAAPGVDALKIIVKG